METTVWVRGKAGFVVSGCVAPFGGETLPVPAEAASGAARVGLPDGVIVRLPLVKPPNWFLSVDPLPSFANAAGVAGGGVVGGGVVVSGGVVGNTGVGVKPGLGVVDPVLPADELVCVPVEAVVVVSVGAGGGEAGGVVSVEADDVVPPAVDVLPDELDDAGVPLPEITFVAGAAPPPPPPPHAASTRTLAATDSRATIPILFMTPHPLYAIAPMPYGTPPALNGSVQDWIGSTGFPLSI